MGAYPSSEQLARAQMALAHSPEQQERWRDLVRSDPAYVVAVLSAFPPDMGSLDGPVQDILAAYAAVFKATDECRPDVWPALVDAGLVDTLCINITRGHASRAGVWIQHWLARFEPLRVLGTMVMRFSSPTNATDMKAMVILRKRWIKMVDSLWEDDYYVRVRDQEQLAFARAMFAEVFFLIIIEQPEFTSEIETTSIKTIRLLARYWSASELFSIDGHSTSHALSEFMQPATGALSAYRTSHPPHPSLFNIILEGAGNSPAQFLTIMAAHVARMPERTDTVFDVSIIHALSQFACDPRSQQDPLSSAFMLQYCEHSALWSALLVVLFESAGHDRLYVPTDKTGFAHKGFTLTVQNIVTMMADALHYLVRNKLIQECRTTVQIWISCGLFAALDAAIPPFLHSVDVAVSINSLFANIDAAMKQDPWLLQILRSQLPRPILADALVRSTSYARTPHLAEGRFESLLKAPSLLEDIEKKGLLQCLRPACNKMPTKQCPECGLCYCTLRCEKQHRKKHKLICVAARSGTTKLIPLDIVFVQVRRCSRWERICYYALSNKLSISLVLGILMFCYIYFA